MTTPAPKPGPPGLALVTGTRPDSSLTRVEVNRNDYFRQSPWTAEVRVHASTPDKALVALSKAYDLAVAQLVAASEKGRETGAHG